jgi:oligopeptidase B
VQKNSGNIYIYELKGKLEEKDESVPYKDNGYWYYKGRRRKRIMLFIAVKESLDALKKET